MSPVKAYYTGVYWSRILSLPLYYILLIEMTVFVCSLAPDPNLSQLEEKGLVTFERFLDNAHHQRAMHAHVHKWCSASTISMHMSIFSHVTMHRRIGRK